MIRFVIALLLATCSSVAFAASNCITSGNVTSWTYFVAVDSSDKTTRETGLSSFTVYRSRNGGAATAFTTPTINETSSSNMPGVYELLLDEDMTIASGNDVEHMVLHITHAGMEPVTKEICIARAKITAGETVTASSGAVSTVSTVSGDVGGIAAGGLTLDAFNSDTNPLFGIARRGTAQSATSTTLVLDSSASFADDVPIGMTLVACGSTQGYCQSRAVTDYTSSSDTATVDAWTVTPSGTITYYLFGTAPVSGSSGGATAQEVWEYSTRTLTALDEDDTTIDLNGTAVGSVAGAVASVTGNVGGTVNGLTSTAQGHVRTAVGLNSANLDTQLSGLSSAASVIDGIVDAIKVTTDKIDDTLEDNSGTYRFTESALAQAPTGEGGGGGGTDWDADERTAIRSILGIPVSGTTPADPSAGILDTIRDAVAAQNDVSTSDVQSAAAAALTAYDPPTRAELTSDISSVLSAVSGLNDIDANDLRDLVIEDQGDGVSLGCALSVILAYAAGDLTTAGNAPTYEDPSGSETRISGTISSAGNRSVTITCPSY